MKTYRLKKDCEGCKALKGDHQNGFLHCGLGYQVKEHFTKLNQYNNVRTITPAVVCPKPRTLISLIQMEIGEIEIPKK